MKETHVTCPNCGMNSRLEDLSISNKARNLVNLYYMYSGRTRENRPEMTDQEINMEKRNFSQLDARTARYRFHKQCARCSFPHDWVGWIECNLIHLFFYHLVLNRNMFVPLDGVFRPEACQEWIPGLNCGKGGRSLWPRHSKWCNWSEPDDAMSGLASLQTSTMRIHSSCG